MDKHCHSLSVLSYLDFILRSIECDGTPNTFFGISSSTKPPKKPVRWNGSSIRSIFFRKSPDWNETNSKNRKHFFPIGISAASAEVRGESFVGLRSEQLAAETSVASKNVKHEIASFETKKNFFTLLLSSQWQRKTEQITWKLNKKRRYWVVFIARL